MAPIHFPLRRTSQFQTPDLAQKPLVDDSIWQDARALLQGVVLSDADPCAAQIQRLDSRWPGIHWYRELPDWQSVEVY